MEIITRFYTDLLFGVKCLSTSLAILTFWRLTTHIGVAPHR